ncbi:MAG: amino acid permease [Bacteroidales bacterium]|nr:amino acid permease [Bacteroidales bacterium]
MAENELKREIGVMGLSANLVNTMVGAGIFVLPAIVAAGLGSASIIAYVLCGLLISLVMLCFAEVGTRITASGGVYAYIEASFGKYFGFIASVLFLVSAVSADAAVINAIGNIAVSIISFSNPGLVKIILFALIFSGLAYINIRGVKQGVGFVKFITLAKMAPVLILILIGLKDIKIANLYWDTFPSFSKLGEISLILFFAFQGSESAISVNGEVKNPQKTIPRAILISVITVFVFYVLVQTITQGVLGADLSDFPENPLGEVASLIVGPVGFTLLTIAAAVSMFGYLSSEQLSIPRVLFRLSGDRVIPIKLLSLVHKKFDTPYVSIIAYALLGFVFASVGGFTQLAVLSSAAALLIYLGVSLAVIQLRRKSKGKKIENIFIIPGGIIIPVISSIAILLFLSNLSRNELIIMGISILILTLVFYGRKYFQKKFSRTP